MKISKGIMLKGSNVFEFTKFRLKTKVVYSVNSNFLFTRRKQEEVFLK